MTICIVQTKAPKGDIEANIASHQTLMQIALKDSADAIFFPELSLTGYEPALLKGLAVKKDHPRLSVFQRCSDARNITIGVGIPVQADDQIEIGLLIFQPQQSRQVYSKQQLHPDELPYFVAGKKQVILIICNKKLAPAICYESLQASHAEKAIELGAEIYIATVAKSQKGLDKAVSHYPQIARRFGMPVLMANAVGYCDNFLSIGGSAVWTKDGKLKAQLDNKDEGLLIFNTETEEIIKVLTGETVP